MKGFLFGGCSFTWGQGLYYYYENINKNFNYNLGYGYETRGISQGMIDYKNSLRFANLVANYFETFYVTKPDTGQLLGNGGCEDETFDFFDYLFNVEKKYTFKDFDYIIIQLSNIFRNSFIFEYKNKLYKRKLVDSHLKYYELIAGEEMKNYMIENNVNFDDLNIKFTKSMFTRIKNRTNYYEERGIKVKFLCMNGDYRTEFIKDEYLENRLIKLFYNDKKYDTINELIENNKNMTLEDDIKFYKFEDRHPSKLCHQIIAKSIIKNIETKI